MQTISVFLLCLLPLVYTQFSQKDKNEIVDEHNSLRSSIAKGSFKAKGKTMPSATNMRKLVWSPVLEDSAQSVSNKCLFQHSGMKGVGENLYMAWSSNTNTIAGKGKASSQAWAKEFQDFGWSDIKLTMNVFNTGIGHATQMAWANTGSVGCGATLCDNKKQVLVVCHYQAQGNFLNQNVYAPGKKCSACPSGTKCETSTGLCVA